MAHRNLTTISTIFAMCLSVPAFAQVASNPHPSGSMATAQSAPGTATGQTVSPSTSNGTATPTSSSTPIITADQQIRASKLIGSTVYNDQHQNIGSIDELLLNKHHKVTQAVLSVGGFLGVGSKLVEVPYQNLHIANNTITMPGASQNQLKKMPTYTFRGAS